MKNLELKNFKDISEDILLKQFDDMNKDIPYGVIAVSNDDHNQGLDRLPIVFQKIFHQSLGHAGLRVIEFDNEYELMKRLALLNNEYGDLNKFSHLILAAHGSQRGFVTDSWEYRDVTSFELESSGTGRMKQFFKRKSEIVLISCSTGAKKGFAQNLSKTYDTRVIAPEKNMQIEDINIAFDFENIPHFSVKYKNFDGHVNTMSYKSGEQEQV